MKRFITTVLAIFYLVVSSGATVHVHYCMGKIVDWSMSDKDATNCDNCGMEKGNSKDCCKDEQHKLEVKESLQAFAIKYQFNFQSVDVPVVQSICLVSELSRTSPADYISSNSPPRTPASPAYIRNCNFRI